MAVESQTNKIKTDLEYFRLYWHFSLARKIIEELNPNLLEKIENSIFKEYKIVKHWEKIISGYLEIFDIEKYYNKITVDTNLGFKEFLYNIEGE